MKIETIFEFVRFAIDDQATQFESHDDLDWESMYDFAVRQTLVGVLFRGIEKLKQHPSGANLPEKQLLLKWYMQAELIRKKNKVLNANAVALCDRFRQDGFEGCILKGQGIACLYPDPATRTSGDIDIWINAEQDKIIEYVNRVCPGQRQRMIHIDFPIFKDSEVEVHFTPSYMYAPWSNKRLQQWFRKEAPSQFANRIELPDNAGEICVPTPSFNRIFILSHIYKHLFSEGIGLRQLMDYYFVLHEGFTPEENAKDRTLLNHLNMYKFAGAVMYVLTTVFGLAPNFCIVESDQKAGEFLLSEILQSGNFGHYDERFGDTQHETKWDRYVRMTRRNLHFVTSYPSEALSEPVLRTSFFFWKTIHHKK
mgnify:CR=1 FL=1